MSPLERLLEAGQNGSGPELEPLASAENCGEAKRLRKNAARSRKRRELREQAAQGDEDAIRWREKDQRQHREAAAARKVLRERGVPKAAARKQRAEEHTVVRELAQDLEDEDPARHAEFESVVRDAASETAGDEVSLKARRPTKKITKRPHRSRSASDSDYQMDDADEDPDRDFDHTTFQRRLRRTTRHNTTASLQRLHGHRDHILESSPPSPILPPRGTQCITSEIATSTRELQLRNKVQRLQTELVKAKANGNANCLRAKKLDAEMELVGLWKIV